MSIDINDPETWTGSYVTSNRKECLITLQAHNLMAIDYLHQKNYLGALAYLNPIREGLLTMHNRGCGIFRSQIATFSMCIALITAFGSFDASVDTRQRREEALAYLEYAKNIVREVESWQSLQSFYQKIIDDLKSCTSLTQIKDKYDFPQSVIDILTSTNDEISP